MLILGSLAALFAVFVIRVRTMTRGPLLETPVLGSLSGAVFTGTVLVLALITLPITHYMARAAMDEVEPVRRSVLIAINTGVNVEKSPLSRDMREANLRISFWRYLNETGLDPWVPDAVDQVDWIRPF